MNIAPSSVSGFGDRVTLIVYWRAFWLAVILAVCLLALIVASLMSGSYPLAIDEVWATLFGTSVSDTAHTVVWEFRFPRTLVAALAGAFFGLSGAILQNVTRNPLADPSLVGVSQGASLAVVTLVVVFPDVAAYWRPLIAFCGALAVAALIQTLTMQRTSGATIRFILTGIGLAEFMNAVTWAMLTYGRVQEAQSALGWLAGSIHAAGWDEAALLGLCLALLIPVLFWASRTMTALRMGPDFAVGLGVRVRPARIGLITLSVALAAFAVAAVGPLGFVGLVAPHLSRRLAHSGVGHHLVLTALTGAVMVCVADFTGRVVWGSLQIPAGVLTAVLGVPVFVLLIVRSQYDRQY